MEYIEILSRKVVSSDNSTDSLYQKGSRNNVSKEHEKVSMVISEVPLETLSQSLSVFSVEMDKVFEKAEKEATHFTLDEIEVNLEISASGGIRLIGAFEASATGGIKLKFKRK